MGHLLYWEVTDCKSLKCRTNHNKHRESDILVGMRGVFEIFKLCAQNYKYNQAYPLVIILVHIMLCNCASVRPQKKEIKSCPFCIGTLFFHFSGLSLFMAV